MTFMSKTSIKSDWTSAQWLTTGISQPLSYQDCYLWTKKKVLLTTTLTHHVIKLQELKTHISICHAHNKRHWLLMSSNSWSMNWISASSPEQQLSFRICQFAWLETLLQKQRWEKRWWCRHKFKRLYYIQNHK